VSLADVERQYGCDVKALLDAASGSLEVGSEGREALVLLYCIESENDDDWLIPALRARGYIDAVRMVKAWNRQTADYENELRAGSSGPVMVAEPVTVERTRTRPRERRAGATSRASRASGDREGGEPPEPRERRVRGDGSLP
jgi:hypothetical protein